MRLAVLYLIILNSLINIGCISMSSKPMVETNLKQEDSSLFLLSQKLREADTILLASHTGIILDRKNSRIIEPEIMIGNKINQKIIYEKKIITGYDIDTLINILLIPKPAIDSLQAKCGFDPHHAIFMIKNGKISFIDLCFHCCGIAASNDLKDPGPFGEQKWMQLIRFFRKLQLNYELPDKIFPIQ